MSPAHKLLDELADRTIRGGFENVIDALDNGRELFETFTDTRNNRTWEEGTYNLEGNKALQYVRTRYGLEQGDFDRIKRQQEFIGALLKKVMSSDVVLDPGKLSDFITAFAKATFGDNLGVKQMMTLAQSMKGLDPSKISFLTVPTVGLPNSRGNEVLVRSKTKALFDALRNNTPLPDPNAPIPQSEQAPPTSTSKSKTSTSKSTTSKKSGTTG